MTDRTHSLEDLIAEARLKAVSRRMDDWYGCLTSLTTATAEAIVAHPDADLDLRLDEDEGEYAVYAAGQFQGWIQHREQLPDVLSHCASAGMFVVSPRQGWLGQLLRLPARRWTLTLPHRLVRRAL